MIETLIKQMRKQERQDAINEMKQNFFNTNPLAKANPNYKFKFKTFSDSDYIVLLTEMNNQKYIVDSYAKLSLKKLIKKYDK